MRLADSLPLPPHITDARHRFREIYRAVRADHGDDCSHDRPVEEALLHFADEARPTGKPVYLGPPRLKLRFMIIPGLIADCLSHRVSPFNLARQHLHQHGYSSEVLWVNGRSSSYFNAAQLHAQLAHYPVDERWVLIGYSKGAVDALQAVVTYPDLRERTAAVISLAGAIGGSPLVQHVPAVLQWLISRINLWGCAAGDGQSLQSLNPALRQAWLKQHRLPDSILYAAIAATPRPERISRILQGNYNNLLEHHPWNDSQVLYHDALIPGGDLLAYANADHWALTLPLARRWPWLRFFVNQNDYPREILLESLVRYVEERLLERQNQTFI